MEETTYQFGCRVSEMFRAAYPTEADYERELAEMSPPPQCDDTEEPHPCRGRSGWDTFPVTDVAVLAGCALL